MIKTLKRKFVLIIMALVGTVLIAVLGSSYVSAWQTQRDITNEALERSLAGNMPDVPRMAIEVGAKDDSNFRDDNHRRANILILAIDLDENGAILWTNDAPVVIDSATLTTVLAGALDAEADNAWDESIHVAWRRRQLDSGTWRVVIADTSAADISLRALAMQDIAIVCVAMAALLLIAIGLSTWVLKPVEAAWEQQRRFVADASHELKTPLAVIIANMQILKSTPNVPSDAQRWIDSTSEESAHMKELVEELLELARTDESSSGAQDIMQHVEVDYSTVVESASLEFDAIAFERGTQIDESVEPGIVVEGDPAWLGRMTKILIDNACKYSQADSPVTVTLSREGKKCVLEVNNHGSVIDAEDLPHVFDRFYRTDRARQRDEHAGGFGLGLAIAKGIVDSHHGTISVASNADDGTTFRVILPCA